MATAVLIATCFLPARQSVATEFRNCSGSDIRISIHDGETGEPVFTGNPGRPFGDNKTVSIPLESTDFLLKVFRVHGGREKLVLVRSGLKADTERYMVHQSGPVYFVSTHDKCTDARLQTVPPTDGSPGTAPVRVPFASIMLDSGTWVSGSITGFQITGFDGQSFRLRLNPGSRKALKLPEQSAENAWSTYTLVNKDTYRDKTGNIFIMQNRFRALWNGIPHRYSWLE
jgi:hypothetical protein